MRKYWVVVKRSNESLYETLKSAFADRHGFTVIQDRRTPDSDQEEWARDERRKSEVWDVDDLLIAEENDW